MLRTGHRLRAIRREAPPVAEDKAIAPRGFARCKTPALTVSTAIFRPLHFAGAPFRRSERWPTSLINPNWSDTPPLGYTAVCRDFPFALSSHSLPFRSTSGESDLLASRSRDCAIGKCAHRLRGGIGMKEMLPGRHTTHIVRSVVPPTLILFAPTLPASGTLRRGIKVRQCGVVCYPAASLSR